MRADNLKPPARPVPDYLPPLKVGDTLKVRPLYRRNPVDVVVRAVVNGVARAEGPEELGLPSFWIDARTHLPLDRVVVVR